MIIKTGFEMRKKEEGERGMMTELTDGRFFFFLNTKLESKPIFFLISRRRRRRITHQIYQENDGFVIKIIMLLYVCT